MTNHRVNPDELDSWMDEWFDGYERDEAPATASIDAAFARDLVELVPVLDPDPAAVERIAARLSLSTPSANPSIDQALETHAMTFAQPQPYHPPRVRDHNRDRWLTLAAALIAVIVAGALLLKLAQPSSIRLPLAASLATATATPMPAPTPTLVPVAAANPLPLIVGGAIDDEFSDETLDRMWEAGMRWVATHAEADVAIPADMLAEVAGHIAKARERGFGILVRVADSSDAVLRAQADDYRTFAEFIGQLAALGPDALEIWPEANLDRAWPTGQIGGAAYVDMLIAAYNAVKPVYPDVWIITGAPAPTGAGSSFPGRVVNDDRFYQEMAEAGAAEYADCIGVHYVEGVVPPDQTEGDPRDDSGTRYLATMLQRAAQPFRDTPIPLCVTELGYASFEGIVEVPPSGFEWAADTSVGEQAQWLARAIQILAETSSVRVALVSIWNVDLTRPDVGPSTGYGIIRPDGTCPACDAIAALKQE